MAVEALGSYRLLGETVDDAACEAFDKTAKLMGLSYPGGPALAKLAEQGQLGRFKLPRPMLHSDDLEMSFSGLKTAVSLMVRDATPADYPDIAIEFQEAVADVLSTKAIRALSQTGLTQLVVAGGVGANQRLRARLVERCTARGAQVFFPPLRLCTDNGAMIAHAAGLRLAAQHSSGARSEKPLECGAQSGGFSVKPRWALSSLDVMG